MSLQNEQRPVKVVACPSCGADVRWEPASIYRPFCSERCRLVDLGAWAAGDYRIPEAAVDEDGEPFSEV